MYKLLLSAIILVIITTGCVIPTYTGKSMLSETEVSKSDQKISSVLIVGAGSTASRLFLENLSTDIIQLFTQQGIHCEFNYVGKIPRGSHVNLKTIANPKYDSYLVLSPMDTSFVDIHKSVAVFATPLPGGYGASGSLIGNQYKEDYYAGFYTSGSSLNKVWGGELKVDFDLPLLPNIKRLQKAYLINF